VVLIDSSVWIATTRRGGDEILRERVNGLIRTRAAAWCAAVRLELWPGAKGRVEIQRLTELKDLIQDLEMTPRVWEKAIGLAGRARTAGLSCPYADLLISACATVHGAELLHRNKHLDLLAAL
jgi:predicted nucleic acid-binding protein